MKIGTANCCPDDTHDRIIRRLHLRDWSFFKRWLPVALIDKCFHHVSFTKGARPECLGSTLLRKQKA
jgi:hypothetical protein